MTAADGGLVVTGGARSLAADTADMFATAGQLQWAALQMSHLVVRLAGACLDARLVASLALDPTRLVTVARVMAGAQVGRHGVLRAAARLGATASRLASAAVAHALAETASAAAVHGVEGVAAVVVPPLLAIPAGASLAAAFLAGRGPQALGSTFHTLSSFVEQHPQVAEAGVDLVGRFAVPVVGAAVLPAGGGRALARTGVALAAPTPLRDSGRVRVTAGAWMPTHAPRTLHDLMAEVDAGYPGRGGRPGTVRVTRLATRGGTPTRWVVTIPGTQSWAGRAGADPLDAASDLASMAGARSSAAALVRQALSSAGARPGEPVLLVGHSLGGMAAAEVAADPGFRRSHPELVVVVAGSPIATAGIPASTPVLSLQHRADPVPLLDGRPNPDRPTWVTVTAATPGGGRNMGAAHDSAGYVATAAAVDVSRDPALTQWWPSLQPFLSAAGATSVDVQGVRVGS